MSNGYYDMSPGELKIKVIDNGDCMVSEEEALELPIGTLFTAINGQWYVKVGDSDYRRWTWT